MRILPLAVLLSVSANTFAGCGSIPYTEMEYMSEQELNTAYCRNYSKENSYLDRAETLKNRTNGPYSIQPMLKLAEEALKCQKQNTRINRFLTKTYSYSISEYHC